MISSLIFIPILVLFIFILILFVPTHMIVEYGKNLSVIIKVCGINLKVFPNTFILGLLKKSPAKNQKPKERKPHPKPDSKIKSIKKVITLINKYINPFLETFRKIFTHFKIHKLYLCVAVSSDEAAKTAVEYYKFKSLIYGIISSILNFCDIKDLKLQIHPDFIAEKTSVKFKFDISARPVSILYELMLFGFRYVKMANSLK